MQPIRKWGHPRVEDGRYLCLDVPVFGGGPANVPADVVVRREVRPLTGRGDPNAVIERRLVRRGRPQSEANPVESIAAVRVARGDAADGRIEREPQGRRKRGSSEATVDRDPCIAEAVTVAVAGRILPAPFAALDGRFGVEAFGSAGESAATAAEASEDRRSQSYEGVSRRERPAEREYVYEGHAVAGAGIGALPDGVTEDVIDGNDVAVESRTCAVVRRIRTEGPLRVAGWLGGLALVRCAGRRGA